MTLLELVEKDLNDYTIQRFGFLYKPLPDFQKKVVVNNFWRSKGIIDANTWVVKSVK